MKKFTFLLMFISAAAFSAEYKSQETNFTIQTWTMYGSTVYYNCDSVETKTKDLLKTLGAKNINVRCTGGIDVFGRFHLPARVSTSFDALHSGAGEIQAEYKEVTFKDFDECHLFNTVYKKVSSFFDLKDDTVRRCLRVNGRTVINAKVLSEL